MTVKVTRSQQPSREPEPLLTFEQVAQLASASVRQVKRWCDEGKLGYVTMPQGRRIRASQWEQFITTNTVDNSVEAA